MNIIAKKNWYFLLSGLVILPGIISLIFFGLHLSIDFTGGSRLEYQVSSIKYQVSNDEIKKIITEQGVEVSSIQKSGQESFIIKTKPISQEQNQKIKNALSDKFGNVEEISFETVGGVVGKETLENALKALLLSWILIILYVGWSFKNWKFGVCAIVALIHDVLVVVGTFSILGKILNVEVDAMFVTAILTIIGFSVHDTIVVFDRIRENLKRMVGTPFEKIVNASILQTMRRSINTSLTVVLVLVALLIFGGETVRWFVVALLVGIISGTYSSIFTASPLLVVWEEWSSRRHSGDSG